MTSLPAEALPPAAAWTFHADHPTLVLEPHARPAMPVSNDDLVVHVCFQSGPEQLEDILDVFGIARQAAKDRFWSATRHGVALKVEQHTEFCSVMLRQPAKGDASNGTLAELLRQLITVEGLRVICLTRVLMLPSAAKSLKALAFGSRIMGGTMCGEMQVRSTLLPDETGFVTFVVQTPAAPSEQLGRRIQRLLEAETYRNMCMLGLPLARRTSERLSGFEAQLREIMASMSAPRDSDDERHFERISQLMQAAHAETAQCRFRFSASLAYNELVLQRLHSLEEEKLAELQTISGFVRSRLDPGVATIRSVTQRQQVLIDDLNQALSLLRTRIDLSLNRDNQTLLKSMDDRHRQQVVIAQTVEGLSAVAISYYLVGLLAYMFKGTAGYLPSPFTPTVLIAISVPLVFFGIWSFLRAMRRKWEAHKGLE